MDKTGYDKSLIGYKDSPFHNIVQTKAMYLDIQKITLLGYHPTLNIYQVVDRLIEYYQREKDGR
jgi:nucleoside-diphosphate-sugar epimerase